MKRSLKFGLFALTVWLALTLPHVVAPLVQQRTIQSNGQFKASVNLDVDVTNILWGEIWPGQSVNTQVTVTNVGNQPVVLSMETSNWMPQTASAYLTLTWDYVGGVVLTGSSQTVLFTLHAATEIDPSILDFSFDITITGTQAP